MIHYWIIAFKELWIKSKAFPGNFGFWYSLLHLLHIFSWTRQGCKLWCRNNILKKGLERTCLFLCLNFSFKNVNKEKMVLLLKSSMHNKIHRISTTLSPMYLFAIRERQKRGLEHFKQVIKIGPNRGHVFQNKLRIRRRRYWKYESRCCYITRRLVCKAKDKNKIKVYKQKAILVSLSTHMF